MEKVFPCVQQHRAALEETPTTTNTLNPQQIPSKLPISTQLGKGEKHKLRLSLH